MSDRPTPETDEIGAQPSQSPHDDYLVMREHARRLERERDELKEALRKIVNASRAAATYAQLRQPVMLDALTEARALLAQLDKS